MDSDFEAEEEEEEGEEEEEEDAEEAVQKSTQQEPIKIETDYQAMMANRNQKRKKKEAREADKDEPLYCFCQQVSYGEMVACDGEVVVFVSSFIAQRLTLSTNIRIARTNGFTWIVLA